jgi:hypothetical protein
MTAAFGDMGSQQGIRAVANGFNIGNAIRFYTGSGTPVSTLSATEIGDLYADYTNGAVYIANATGLTSWQRIFSSSTSAAPFSLGTTADTIGIANYWTSAATSGTTYGWKNTLTGTGIGAEFIGGRDRCILTAAAGNAHGYHGTLEVKNTGYVSGMGTGIRGNIVFGTDTAVAAGTYYGMLAEIYAIGNTCALPATSNACLGINLQAGTAMDLVGNAISFSGTDGSGKMIYTHAPTTLAGSIRILVNGVVKYLPYYTTQ